MFAPKTGGNKSGDSKASNDGVANVKVFVTIVLVVITLVIEAGISMFVTVGVLVVVSPYAPAGIKSDALI